MCGAAMCGAAMCGAAMCGAAICGAAMCGAAMCGAGGAAMCGAAAAGPPPRCPGCAMACGAKPSAADKHADVRMRCTLSDMVKQLRTAPSPTTRRGPGLFPHAQVRSPLPQATADCSIGLHREDDVFDRQSISPTLGWTE